MSDFPAPIDPTWTATSGEADGRPVHVRYRARLEPQLGHARWPNRLIIVWPYPPDGVEGAHGLPSSSQHDEMERFEATLVGHLEPRGTAVLTAVVTTNGHREWIWYCGEAAEFQAECNAALAGTPRRPVSLFLDHDPGWTQYRQLVSVVGEVD